MLTGRFVCAVLLFSMSLPSVALTRPRRGPTSHSKSHSSSKSTAKRGSGQRSIDDSRATEIQSALIRSGYLSDSAASGHWDAQTEAAMQKFQADNGWQTKLIPDSRAIIKLGLGPHNASQPATAKSSPMTTSSLNVPASGFAPRQ